MVVTVVQMVTLEHGIVNLLLVIVVGDGVDVRRQALAVYALFRPVIQRLSVSLCVASHAVLSFPSKDSSRTPTGQKVLESAPKAAIVEYVSHAATGAILRLPIVHPDVDDGVEEGVGHGCDGKETCRQ